MGSTPSPGVPTVTFYDPHGIKKTVKKEVVHYFFYQLADYFEHTDKVVYQMFMEMSVGNFPRHYAYVPPTPGEQHRLTFRRRKHIFTCELSNEPEQMEEMGRKIRNFIYETSGVGSAAESKDEKEEAKEPEQLSWSSIANKPRLVTHYLDVWVKRQQMTLGLTPAETRALWRELELLLLKDALKGGSVVFDGTQIVSVPALTYQPLTRTFNRT